MSFAKTSMLVFSMTLAFGVCSGTRLFSAEPNAATKEPAFHVWTSSGCSRSLRADDSFSTPDEAFVKATALRAIKGYKFVFVTFGTGSFSEGMETFQHLRTPAPKAKFNGISVYRRSCRSIGWARQALVNDLGTEETAKRVDELKQQDPSAEIVYEFASPAKS